jgi:polysaccharide export outer membrane protein
MDLQTTAAFLARHARLLLLVAAAFALSSCAGGPSRTATVDQVGTTTPVVLSPGDVIRISFTTAPEMNQAQKIRADGKVSLPAVGQVTAAGKTLAQLESELKRLYSSQITNTDVLLTLDSAVIEVYMAGAVRSPGKQVFDRPTTLLQAIMQAGGPNAFANMKSVRVIRLTSGVQRMQLVDLRPTLAGEPTRPFYVKNGDIVQVPQSAF